MLILTHHNLAEGGGQVAKAKRVQGAFEGPWDTELLGFEDFSDTDRSTWLIRGPEWLMTLTRKVARGTFDIAYCVNSRHIVVFLYFLRVVMMKHYKIVYDTEMTWRLSVGPNTKRTIREVQERLAAACANLVAANSTSAMAFFRWTRVTFVPNFVDCKTFKHNYAKGQELRSEYGFKDSDRVIGVVGPFNNPYNLPVLEFIRNHQFDEGIKFLVIGSCGSEYIVRRANIVYTGYVSDYVAHLSCLDGMLVFRTVPTDGAINRIVEGMSMALPVFVNMTAFSTMDYIASGQEILAFDNNALPGKLNNLIFDKEMMGDIGRRARLAVERYYSQEVIEERFRESLGGLLDSE